MRRLSDPKYRATNLSYLAYAVKLITTVCSETMEKKVDGKLYAVFYRIL